MLARERARLAASAMAVRLPTVYGFREHVEDGGLISYGISVPVSAPGNGADPEAAPSDSVRGSPIP